MSNLPFSVTQNGKPLDPSQYTWDPNNNTFSSSKDNLVIDANNINNLIFKTGDDCTFKTGWDCTFHTGKNCTFKTGDDCTFKTGDDCTFKTGWDCTFHTGKNCTFKTGDDCTFKTGWDCTFHTGFSCIFKTGKNCVGIRYDVDGIIHIPENKKIKYKEEGIAGYVIIEDEQPKILSEIEQDLINLAKKCGYKLIKDN